MQIHMLLFSIRHRLILLKRFKKYSKIMKSFTSFTFIAISMATFFYGSAVNKGLHKRVRPFPDCRSRFECSPALCPYGFFCTIDDIRIDDTFSSCSASIQCTSCKLGIVCRLHCPNGYVTDEYGCTVCQCL